MVIGVGVMHQRVIVLLAESNYNTRRSIMWWCYKCGDLEIKDITEEEKCKCDRPISWHENGDTSHYEEFRLDGIKKDNLITKFRTPLLKVV